MKDTKPFSGDEIDVIQKHANSKMGILYNCVIQQRTISNEIILHIFQHNTNKPKTFTINYGSKNSVEYIKEHIDNIIRMYVKTHNVKLRTAVDNLLEVYK